MSNEKRTFRINVRLSEDMKQRAQTLADDLGTPLSTYLAVLIGQGVVNQERASKAHTEAMTGIIEMVSDQLKDINFDELPPNQQQALKALGA